MSRSAPEATNPASTPPADGTSVFDRCPTEVVNLVIAHTCPSTTISFLGHGRRRHPHDEDHTLLALRSTCHLFEILCEPFKNKVYGDFPDAVEASTERLLGILQVSRPRARRCRKLVFAQTPLEMIQQLRASEAEWAMVLPALDEVVLSNTATFDLGYLAVFPRLAHLTVENQAFCTSSPRLTLPSLVSLTLSTVTTKQYQHLRKASMPSLRYLSIGDVMLRRQPSPASLAATDLLGQLNFLEIGEDHKAGSDTSILVPFSSLPPFLPVVWRIGLDSPLARPLARALSVQLAAPRRTFVRIDGIDGYAVNDVDPRLARLNKMGVLLSALPYLQLVLVPRDFWDPTPAPSTAATAAQTALRHVLAVRNVEVIAFDPDEHGGVAAHLKMFLRSRSRRTTTRLGPERST
ncbi:hypothetical protein JCM8208_005006 [Rhodotorula glutinis]